MVLAGIDIGTNTLRLLIADISSDTYRELYSDRKITRLGQNLDRTGMLSQDAEERSLNALKNFSEKIRRHSVHASSAVGTSALRNAANAAEFIREVKRKTDIDINVISGDDEARLTLLGVSRVLGAGSLVSSLMIDIGGGSTEIIVTRPGSMPVEASMPLGAVYLTERFIQSDPPSGDELVRLRKAIRKNLDRHDRFIRQGQSRQMHTPAVFAGTAGTITTLAAMDQGLVEYDPVKINNYTLARKSIDKIVQTLGKSTLDERRKMAGLEPGREDIILAGAMIAQEIMERYGYVEMLVSDWGLREGIVLDLYKQLSIGHRA